MSPASYLAAPPRDIVFCRGFAPVTQNSSFIILKRKSFVNCFFAKILKKIKKFKKIFFDRFFNEKYLQRRLLKNFFSNGQNTLQL